MKHTLNDFLVSEDGAVTVDWVVLTAAIVGLALLVTVPIAYGTNNLADKVTGYIGDVPVDN